MKRLLVGSDSNVQIAFGDLPDELREYACELRLLNGVPVQYLLSSLSDLPEESLRFFFVDINWTDALIDGAFSIGRVCRQDGKNDSQTLRAAQSGRYADVPRIRQMHHNHKKKLLEGNRLSADEDFTVESGFVMRSSLVRRMKGLHLSGYAAGGKDREEERQPLPILRMDTIADDVLLCLFRGQVSEIVLEEPKTGLAFGVSAVEKVGDKITRSMDLRSALDSEDLGNRIDSFCVDPYTDENGRMHPKRLAAEMEAVLKSHGKLDASMTPSRFAFEMIAAGHRARFSASEKE